MTTRRLHLPRPKRESCEGRHRLPSAHPGAIRRIESYCAAGRAAFLATPMMQDAVVRNLEIIGEAAGKVGLATQTAHPSIAWRQIAGMRSVLIHNYMGVDLARVWEVVERRLPELRKRVEAILDRS
ncbi:MAG TPA: DUF86 domain-containing protein [Stellaceae bacterium]|nr:DUF86 domain-containing protein [Stellaceae bacterium]